MCYSRKFPIWRVMGNSQPYTKSTMYIKTIDIVLIDVENDQEYIQRPKLARKLTILTLKAQICNINNEISVKNMLKCHYFEEFHKICQRKLIVKVINGSLGLRNICLDTKIIILA